MNYQVTNWDVEPGTIVRTFRRIILVYQTHDSGCCYEGNVALDETEDKADGNM